MQHNKPINENHSLSFIPSQKSYFQIPPPPPLFFFPYDAIHIIR